MLMVGGAIPSPGKTLETSDLQCLSSFYNHSIILFSGISSMWRVEGNMFIIPSVSREMLDMKVECGVTNAEGRGSDSVTIAVACEYQLSARVQFTLENGIVIKSAKLIL